MPTAQQYRAHAEECVELAKRARPQDKAILLEMAEAWLRLADEADKAEGKTQE